MSFEGTTSTTASPLLRADPRTPSVRVRERAEELAYGQHARQQISPRRTIIACLAGSGLRNTELCRIDVRDVDFAHGHINVEDAKTDAGVRRVDLSPCSSMTCSPGAPR